MSHTRTKPIWYRRTLTTVLAVAAVLFLALGNAQAEDPPDAQTIERLGYGAGDDVAFANDLWSALMDGRLVGERSVHAQPYEGTVPHGAILITLEALIEVAGREATAIVKKNYLGDELSIESVATNPGLFLDSITVMYRRTAGYDPENSDWFWAKFNDDGSLQTNPVGVPLAGRVGKESGDACIACHTAAPGDDRVFLHDRFAEN